ncbi:hypothetical protein INR49_007528 [Caranx melampygus]|nr:hypothetical protein INR49_007528 [Caranx melampygus]
MPILTNNLSLDINICCKSPFFFNLCKNVSLMVYNYLLCNAPDPLKSRLFKYTKAQEC